MNNIVGAHEKLREKDYIAIKVGLFEYFNSHYYFTSVFVQNIHRYTTTFMNSITCIVLFQDKI